MKHIVLALLMVSTTAWAAPQDLLIKLAPGTVQSLKNSLLSLNGQGGHVEVLTDTWVHVKASGNEGWLNAAIAKSNPPARALRRPAERVVGAFAKKKILARVGGPLLGWRRSVACRPPES